MMEGHMPGLNERFLRFIDFCCFLTASIMFSPKAVSEPLVRFSQGPSFQHEEALESLA